MAFVDLSLNRYKGHMVSQLKETQRNDAAKTKDDKNIVSVGDSIVVATWRPLAEARYVNRHVPQIGLSLTWSL